MHIKHLITYRSRISLTGLIAIAFTLIVVVSSCSESNEPSLVSPESPNSSVTQPETPSSPPAPSPAPTPTPMPIPTPTPVPTPTPTLFEQGEIDEIIRSPFNGMSVNENNLTRRILVVKIDNHEEARPQSGIELADMMIEVWVEGITRYLAVFQESDADFVGPIRSMRPTDFALQNPWASTFINSGGQDWIQAIGDASTARGFIEPPGSFRISARPRPWNLY